MNSAFKTIPAASACGQPVLRLKKHNLAENQAGIAAVPERAKAVRAKLAETAAAGIKQKRIARIKGPFYSSPPQAASAQQSRYNMKLYLFFASAHANWVG